MRCAYAVLVLATTLGARRASAQPCATQMVDAIRVVSCQVRVGRDDLQLFWRDAGGNPIGSLARLDSLVRASGRALRFATNAGIFAPGQIPQGLFIQSGVTLVPLNRRDTVANPMPNFYLKPNGVFALANGRALIVDADTYDTLRVAATMAVQSGPLLVRQGAIHPAFSPTSRSRLVRNGVGVRADGTIVFAMALDPVSLYTFAQIFRDALDCPDALFLDGAISQFYLPPGRPDSTGQFAGLFAVTAATP